MEGPRKEFKIAATYAYQDESGKVLFEVCRLEPKDFRQRRPDATSLDGWTWQVKGVRQVPFRLPGLIAAVKGGQSVFIAEGEKDVEALVAKGFAATCNACGAGKWRDEFGEHFDSAKAVIVIADKDCPGRAHAVSVATKLKPFVRSIKIIELPDIEARPVKDAVDFFAAGGTGECLRSIAAEAPEFVPKEELTPGKWFKQRFPKLAEKFGDADAWRRRLVIVKYEQSKPKAPIPNFAEKIVAEEGPGVLNWMLDGLDALRKAEWQLHLNERQQARVDDLLLESDSHREFVREMLVKDSNAPGMTKAEVFAAYVEYTEKRNWRAMPKNRFGALVPDVIAQELGLSIRGDVTGGGKKQNDGWKYLRLKKEMEDNL